MNLLFIPLTIGLPAIDESLEKLLTAMETFPNVAVLGDAVSMAKALGLCLALCVGSYECWIDARKAWHGCHEAAAYHRHFPVYFILFMDMLGSAGSGKESGVRYMGYGQGKEQGSSGLRAEGGTETE